MPQKETSINGRLHFEPLLQEVKAKRSSTIRKSRTVTLQPISMDRAKFSEVIIKVLEGTVRKLRKTKIIRIIVDRAGATVLASMGKRD